MTGQHSDSLLKGALILSFAGLFGKVISAGYRVPLQNITGDLGFYIYQQIYPILGMALVLSLYGFPAAISKLVAEMNEEDRKLSVFSFCLPVFLWLLLLSGGVFLIGYTLSPALADLMEDQHLTASLRWAFLVFLFVPVLSLFRGISQGYNQMTPTAVSQMVEQLIRVGGIILTALLVHKFGSIYLLGMGVSIGSMAGAAGGAVVLFIYLKGQLPWSWERWTHRPSYVKTIFLYGAFISINYMMLLAFQWVDALTVVPGLIEAGQDTVDAKIHKGIFDRGQPLIQLGTVLASSLALAIIPSVSKARRASEPEKVRDSIISSVKISFIIGLGATVGLLVLFPAVNKLLFQSMEGTYPLRILMLVIVLSSLVLTMSSVLQGLDYVFRTAFIVLGGVILKLILNLRLIPDLYLAGAAVASIVAVAFVLAGNLLILRKEFNIRDWLNIPWLKIMAAVFIMGMAVAGLRVAEPLFLDHRLLLLLYTVSVCSVGAFLYLFFLIKLGVFSKQELSILPYYEKWQRILPKGLKS